MPQKIQPSVFVINLQRPTASFHFEYRDQAAYLDIKISWRVPLAPSPSDMHILHPIRAA